MWGTLKSNLLLVYLFSVLGVLNSWAQTQIGSSFIGPSFNYELGYSVSMSADGQRIAISTINGSSGSGEAFIYEFSGGVWQQLGSSITGENASDTFGVNVKLSHDGNIIAISSDQGGINGSGYAKIYEYNDTFSSWQQLGDNIEAESGDGFTFRTGFDMNSSGTIVAIGARENDTGGNNAGLVRVYEYASGNWNSKGGQIIGNLANSQFGHSIDLNDDGTKIVIGAPNTDGGYIEVHEYNASSNQWDLVGSRITIGQAIQDNFGEAVSINGDGTKIAFSSSSSDKAKIYEYNNTFSSWQQLGSDINGTANSEFGSSLVLNSSGDRIFVGGVSYDEGSETNNGLLRVFDYNGGAWQQFGDDITGDQSDEFGWSVATSSNGMHAIVSGLQGNGTASGVAKVYFIAQENTFKVLSSSDSWNDPDNWSLNEVPNANHNVIIDFVQTSIPEGESFTVNNLTLLSFASCTIEGSLTVNGDVVNNSLIELKQSSNNASSFIVQGTTSGSGDFKYNRDLLTDNWYLISSPVVGESVADFISNNSLAVGSGGANIGFAPYNNTNGLWDYFQVGTDYSSSIMESGNGYSIKLQSPSSIGFTGEIPTENIACSIEEGLTNGFNLIGNPYPSFVNSTDLLTQNSGIINTQTLWVWDQSLNNGNGAYDTYNLARSMVIAPGQGFFVESNAIGGDFRFLESMQSHNGGTDTFKNSDTRPEIRLTLTDGNLTRDTDVYYIPGTTTGFDNGFDSPLFGAGDNSFAVYTHLVSNSEGSDFSIQSLPPDNYENMIIPLGVNASSGMSIEISASNANLPTGINVYLEDRDKGVFALLSESNTSYQITLDSDESGIGRFYLRTTSATLSSGSTPELLEQVSIYTIDNHSNIRLTGLKVGEHAEVTIYDVLGKQIHRERLIGNGVNDLEGLPTVQTGIYIIRLSTDTGSMSTKTLLR